MHIEHLEECIVLSQTLNFTRAAEKLYMAQPVLSRHVAKLEETLGIKIFVRTRHGMRVTRDGRGFLEDAQKVVDAYHAMMGNLSPEEGTLQVGFVSSSVSPYILELQQRFKEACPQVEAQYHSMSRIWEPLKRLEDRTIDVAIGAILESSLRDKYRYRVLYEDSYAAVVNGRHPLASHESVTPEDLSHYELLLPDERLVEQDEELKGLLGKTPLLRCKHTLHDVNSLPIMLASGNSVSIAMGSLERYYPSSANLVFIPIESVEIKLPVIVAWNGEAESDSLLSLVDIAEDLMSES